MLRGQYYTANALACLLLVVEDGALPQNSRAVVKLGLKMDILLCHGQHSSRNGKDLTHGPDRFRKRAANAVEGCQKQISEVLSCQGTL